VEGVGGGEESEEDMRVGMMLLAALVLCGYGYDDYDPIDLDLGERPYHDHGRDYYLAPKYEDPSGQDWRNLPREWEPGGDMNPLEFKRRRFP